MRIKLLEQIIETLKSHHTFLLTSHTRLDGDALGSELALYHLLKSMGKEALIYNQDETPGNYSFLPGAESIINDFPDLRRFEVLIVLDCSDLERVGDKAHLLGKMKRIINIDHHVSNGNFTPLTFIDGEASSTGEMLYRLLMKMGADISYDVANNLYASILTDTGGFRYRSTGRDTLLAAGLLVEKGADPQWIAENIYENNPREKIYLTAKALESLSFYLGGKVAAIDITLDMLEETGAKTEHIEGLVDIPRTISGVFVSIVFLQLTASKYKLSFRSKGKIDVEKVARRFGGGGHINAAACQVEGDLTVIKGQVTSAMEQIIRL